MQWLEANRKDVGVLNRTDLSPLYHRAHASNALTFRQRQVYEQLN